MGETGPCGPCSELLYDRGEKFGKATNPLEDPSGERFLEYWNLVFMQFNRSSDGVNTPLPKPSIDTGAGIERVVSLINNVDNVFQTDVLRGIITKVEQISNIPYLGYADKQAPAFHVIADHLRSLSFSIADGVQPSNVDRGYVLRKILRRAVRYGRTLNIHRPFLADLLPTLIDSMGDDYPEIKTAKSRIEEILTLEEEAFIRTLKRGGNILNQVITEATSKKQKISGEDAFKLKDTYGFPLEEILLIAKDSHLSVNVSRYEELEEEARERSRKAHKTTHQVASSNIFEEHVTKEGTTEFIGFETLESTGKVKAILQNGQFIQELNEGEEGMIILDRTPFYAEMGGQIGDTGSLIKEDHSHFSVSACQAPFKEVIGHIGKVTKGSIRLTDSLETKVDITSRHKIENNHTATHLLHWALHEIIGSHVKQAGSVVDSKRLRFDFSHHKALSLEESQQIEDLVNAKIRENLPVKSYEIPYEKAQKRADIKQFFGDKYGAVVRVVDIDYSKELCGGTHTSFVGNIGLFRIAKEGSIAAGVRRIEGVTGREAELFVQEKEGLLESIGSLLKTPTDKIPKRIEGLLSENKKLQQELESAKSSNLEGLISSTLSKKVMIQNTPLLVAKLDVDPSQLQSCTEKAMEKLQSGVIVFACHAKGRCQLVVKVSDDQIEKGIKANAIIKEIAPIIGGGGGGKPQQAQAGGKKVEGISEALEKVKELLSVYV